MLAFHPIGACRVAMNRHQPTYTRLLRQLVDEPEAVLDVVLLVLGVHEEKHQMDWDEEHRLILVVGGDAARSGELRGRSSTNTLEGKRGC